MKSLISHLIFSFCFFLVVVSLASAKPQPCYRQDASQFGDTVEEYMHICNPSSSISHCCSPSDYCLENGLCLDAAGDNLYSVQGCSDKTWSAPCHGGLEEWMTPKDQEKGMGYVFIGPCDHGISYCPGAPECCEDEDIPKILVPLFHEVYKPGEGSGSTDMQAAIPD
ncbi:hypothetical protein MKZ38_001761 [Zalerion maritima]|uniref:Uncharacterized protein n=1 Tax=Zalerion maritima TaxID=339359 RepID=A0AAD5WUX3_9PEZI|nr:hypothetical protein MKZ38_001761 [Zalerion maritima]